MENPEAIREALLNHSCSDNYWRAFPQNDKFLFTDGVKDMAERCGAFWLITAVFSWQLHKKVSKEPFQVWILSFADKEKGDNALLVCEDGNHKELARQEIEYTNFPLSEGIKLYLEGNVLLLPSEH